jgi:hypothetical protein
MSELPTYPKLPDAKPVQTTVERSVSRESSFSTPGHVGKGPATKSKSGWKPAKGVRYRATAEKAKGRPRIHARDRRDVQYF